MSLWTMSDSILEDRGAILVWVDLDGELEVDITVTVVTRAGTGMTTSKECLHILTLIFVCCSLYSLRRR